MKNSFLSHGDWSSLSSEPSKSGSSSIYFALTNSPQTSSHWFAFFEFPEFFDWPTIETNEKTRKLSSKHVSGGERARRSHRKKIASVGAANQVFFVVAKCTGTAPTASASEKLAARTVTQIKV
jgi:hypothetical protein